MTTTYEVKKKTIQGPSLSEEFKKITGISLRTRQTNYYFGAIERKDMSFHRLTTIYFSNRADFNKLQRIIIANTRREFNETNLALAGYVYYILADFKKARKFFLNAVSLNPDNLDNWLDLAFTLRHLGEEEISNGILFYFNYVIYYYKYLKLNSRGYSMLQKLISCIVSHLN